MPSPRPAWHFTPHRNWMNDPNGLVWIDGVFHVFYQYNPHGSGWGNMSWGHAVSADLYQWDELEVAIPCRAGEQVYSGSAVVDATNTSGLGATGEPVVVAAYTAVGSDGTQAQALAYSRDEGRSFSRYAGNPVIDRHSLDFRDPKVFWFDRGSGAGHWVMVAVEAVERAIIIYSSDDLIAWSEQSRFDLPTPGPGVWECPDLFALNVDGDAAQERWVMVLSTNTEDPADEQGSAIHWLVGEFDGVRFAPAAHEVWRRLDHGRDFYAGVTFSGAPEGRRIILGWMSNWQYARHVPTSPFRGALSLPRELELRSSNHGTVLVQTPVGFDAERWASALSLPSLLVDRDSSVEMELGLVAFLEISVDLSGGGEVRYELWDGLERRLVIVLDGARRCVRVRREGGGTDSALQAFESECEIPIVTTDGATNLRLFVDAHLIEIFAARGEAVMSYQAFVGEAGWGMRVSAAQPIDVELRRLR